MKSILISKRRLARIKKLAISSEEKNLMEDVASILKKAGFEVYLVGGIVRDLVLGKPGSDYDLTTNATLDDINRLMTNKGYVVNLQEGSNSRVALVYKEHGNSLHIDVAEYRKDIETFGRKVKTEHAQTLEEDLARRDFTINAMAMNPFTMEIIDPFGGRDDLKNKTLKAVGNPHERFTEDYLRILRGLRFATTYGLQIDPKTEKAMEELAYRIPEINQATKEIHVPAERIMMELVKTIEKGKLSQFVELADKLNLMKYIGLGGVQELKDVEQSATHHPEGNVLKHTLMVLKELENMEGVEKETLLAALFHDIGKKITQSVDSKTGKISFKGHETAGLNVAENILRALKFPNETIEIVKNLIKNHMILHQYNEISDKTLRKLYTLFGPKIDQLLKLNLADTLGRGEGAGVYPQQEMQEQKDILGKRIQQIKEGPPPPPESLIDGDEIMSTFGIKPGTVIGKIKAKILDKQQEYANPDIETMRSFMKTDPEIQNLVMEEKQTYSPRRAKRLIGRHVCSNCGSTTSDQHPEVTG